MKRSNVLIHSLQAMPCPNTFLGALKRSKPSSSPQKSRSVAFETQTQFSWKWITSSFLDGLPPSYTLILGFLNLTTKQSKLWFIYASEPFSEYKTENPRILFRLCFKNLKVVKNILSKTQITENCRSKEGPYLHIQRQMNPWGWTGKLGHTNPFLYL